MPLADTHIQALSTILDNLDTHRRLIEQDPTIRKENRTFIGGLLNESQDGIDIALDRLRIALENPQIEAALPNWLGNDLSDSIAAEVLTQSITQAQAWMGEDVDTDPMPPWTGPNFPGEAA